MSVKFEKETTTKTTAAVADALEGKDGVMHNLGQALTKGGGPNGYLAVSVVRFKHVMIQFTDCGRVRHTSSSCRATRCAPRC